jgi:hypothetical protein
VKNFYIACLKFHGIGVTALCGLALLVLMAFFVVWWVVGVSKNKRALAKRPTSVSNYLIFFYFFYYFYIILFVKI